MNTGAVITAVGTGFTAIATILVGWFVRRTDRAAKLTQQYMDDAAFNMELVGALRDDYWALADCYYQTRSKWHRLLSALPDLLDGNREELMAVMKEIGDLPPMPDPRHRQLERLRNRPSKRDIKDSSDAPT